MYVGAIHRLIKGITSLCLRSIPTKHIFKFPLVTKTKWSSHIVCHNCEEMLRDWTKGKRKGLPFGVSMVWRESQDHVTNCYFCMVNTKDVGKKNRHKISYPSIPSAIRPVPHLKNLQSRFLVVFPQVQTVMMISKSMKAAITKRFLNLNPFQITPIGYQPLSCLAKRN